MSLKSQQRIAAKIMKTGVNRVWIDPNRIDDVEAAITREEIRRLIHEQVIVAKPKQGVCRVRARITREKRKKGLMRGPGTKSGPSRSRITRKQAWITKIRALRKTLREWKKKRTIQEDSYRKLYSAANSGLFSSISAMERYAKTHELWRKR